MKTVEKVEVPRDSLIAAVPFSDYADAYRVKLDAERYPDVDSVARAFVETSPAWISALMRLRDALVGPFGLKRSVDAPTSPDFIGFFRVLERNDREILAGEDDRHLDFRISFLYEPDGWLVVTTVVKFNNAFGRAYFVPVAPFHRRIVPAMLRAVS